MDKLIKMPDTLNQRCPVLTPQWMEAILSQASPAKTSIHPLTAVQMASMSAKTLPSLPTSQYHLHSNYIRQLQLFNAQEKKRKSHNLYDSGTTTF